jgi:hypothetical protein
MADSGEKLSLGQAAKLAGRSKPTISAWLKSGRISGSKRPDGVYEIDPAEILRIGDARTGPQKGRVPAAQRGDAAGTRASRESAADVEIRLLREQVDDLTRREAEARGEAAESLARERALADRIGGLIEDQRKKGGFWARIRGE